MRILAGLFFTALIGGCTTSSSVSGPSDHAQLVQKCEARGGHLKPIPGANNANEAANFYCDLPAEVRQR